MDYGIQDTADNSSDDSSDNSSDNSSDGAAAHASSSPMIRKVLTASLDQPTTVTACEDDGASAAAIEHTSSPARSATATGELDAAEARAVAAEAAADAAARTAAEADEVPSPSLPSVAPS